MSDLPDDVGQLAALCREERKSHVHGDRRDERACRALFEHAFCDGVQRAWDLLYEIYLSQVRAWVRARPSVAGCPDAIETLADLAFARFWRAYSCAKLRRHERLGRTLTYLKMCVASEVLDCGRGAARAEDVRDELERGGARSETNAERGVLRDEEIGEILERILAHLKDDRERRLFELSYVKELTPSEIADALPKDFPDVRAVYRAKENLLARLRRDDKLRASVRELLGIAEDPDEGRGEDESGDEDEGDGEE